MAQPSTQRLITEAVHQVKQAIQDGRLVQLEEAAGFPNDPHEVNDTVMDAVLADAVTAFTKRANSMWVGRSELSTIVDVGAADLGNEIQSKIDMLNPFGGGIIDLSGDVTYAINATLKLYPGIRLRGRNKNTRITATGDFPIFESGTPGTRIDDVGLQDLDLFRYSAGLTTPILDWTGISHSNIRDVEIEQTNEPSTTIGVLLGAESYYNEFTSVQVRGTDIGFKLQNAANGNRFNGGTLALHCNDSYIVEGSNANFFSGASAELCDGVAFSFRLGSKKNVVMGCRVENVPTAFQVLFDAENPAFDNYFIANPCYVPAGGVEFDIRTSNVVIRSDMAKALEELTSTNGRTFVDAYKNIAQETLPDNMWTKVTFEAEPTDHLGECTNSTVTVQSDGVYTVNALATFPTVDAGHALEIAVYKNESIWEVMGKDISTAGQSTRTGGVAQLKLVAGDRVEIYAKASPSVAITSSRMATHMQLSRHA